MVIWISQAFSLFGSAVVEFALAWYLTIKTGSATILATSMLVAILPQIVLGPFIGPYIDRWDRKRIMILADAAISLMTLGLAVLFWIECHSNLACLCGYGGKGYRASLSFSGQQRRGDYDCARKRSFPGGWTEPDAAGHHHHRRAPGGSLFVRYFTHSGIVGGGYRHGHNRHLLFAAHSYTQSAARDQNC